jgi:hypothetical protein
MAKSPKSAKRGKRSKGSRKTAASRNSASKKTRPIKSTGAKRKAPRKEVVSQAAIARAKRLEKLDAGPPRAAKKKGAIGETLGKKKTLVSTASLKNPSFPDTYIQQVHVSLNDPTHAMTLTWTGPDAASQQTGPFHTSPGAGLRGFNCDDVATSRRSGSLCTPKGTFTVEGFARHLNSDSRATYVTFFVRARGIGLHYFPTVPNVAASHGCVRIQDQRIAQLIHDNARAGLTQVVVNGTWTKPPKQW